MSTDWGIGCRTCRDGGKPREDYFTGEWDNCRDLDGLRKLVRAQDAVVAVHRALGDQVSFCWSAWGDNIARDVATFFEQHAGHVLAPMNEYGKFDDQCGKHVRCSSCSHQHSCVLDAGHVPPCTPVLPEPSSITVASEK